MRKHLSKIGLLGLGLLLGIVACGPASVSAGPIKPGNDGYRLDHIAVDSGTVECLRYIGSGPSASISCDWNHVK